ncbi:hypothetical protein [Nesterenkonia marinintestina]|uniref:hypothetical protein n=1 Tax=Nesterenkonia marinintestina TaxID=2979865 RepID=UPI0021C13584|nr:hypothetical protein [Nesterenkonia sp. GX14115]
MDTNKLATVTVWLGVLGAIAWFLVPDLGYMAVRWGGQAEQASIIAGFGQLSRLIGMVLIGATIYGMVQLARRRGGTA